jgi:hypothetical protein
MARPSQERRLPGGRPSLNGEHRGAELWVTTQPSDEPISMGVADAGTLIDLPYLRAAQRNGGFVHARLR